MAPEKALYCACCAGWSQAILSRWRSWDRPCGCRPIRKSCAKRSSMCISIRSCFSTSVFSNIAYGLAARGKRKAEIARIVDDAMEWAGIAHLRGSSPGKLSGGEKQRVALARAKVLAPKLLLLDEPTSNLDGPAREKVIALMPTLISEGSSVIMACHDRDLIGLPGVRRLKLRDGALEYR